MDVRLIRACGLQPCRSSLIAQQNPALPNHRAGRCYFGRRLSTALPARSRSGGCSLVQNCPRHPGMGDAMQWEMQSLPVPAKSAPGHLPHRPPPTFASRAVQAVFLHGELSISAQCALLTLLACCLLSPAPLDRDKQRVSNPPGCLRTHPAVAHSLAIPIQRIPGTPAHTACGSSRPPL